MPRPKKVCAEDCLVRSTNWSGSTMSHGLVFRLERADGADADDPGHAELLHAPDVGAVVELAGQNPVAAPVPGQKHDLAPRQLAGEETVRGRAKGRLDLDPLLLGKAFDMIEAAAADDADAMLRHGRGYSSGALEMGTGKTGCVGSLVGQQDSGGGGANLRIAIRRHREPVRRRPNGYGTECSEGYPKVDIGTAPGPHDWGFAPLCDVFSTPGGRARSRQGAGISGWSVSSGAPICGSRMRSRRTCRGSDRGCQETCRAGSAAMPGGRRRPGWSSPA